MVGRSWTVMKEDEKGTYYLLNGTNGSSRFGDTNNYDVSELREDVNKSELLTELKNEFGDRLVPVTMNLMSLDGLKDYGVVEGDMLGVYTLDMFRECRENIPNVEIPCWTSTPDSTPSGSGQSCVRYFDSGGGVVYYGAGWNVGGVRPFCIIQS